MHDFDVIIGMDWLVSYHAVIDYFNKKITCKVNEGNTLFEGVKKLVTTHVISTMKADCMMKVDCEGFIVFITEDKRSKWIEEIPYNL